MGTGVAGNVAVDVGRSFMTELSVFYNEKSQVFWEALGATGRSIKLWWSFLGPLMVLIASGLRTLAEAVGRMLAPLWPHVRRAGVAVRARSAEAAIMAWPHVKAGSATLARGIRSADPKILAVVFLASAALVAGYVCLSKLMRNRQQSSSSSREQLARTSAVILSYMTLAVILLLPDAVFVNDVVPKMVLIYLPLLMSVRTLMDSGTSEAAEDPDKVLPLDHWLCYWSVYSVFDTVWRLPGLGQLVHKSPVLGRIRMFGGIWLGAQRFGGAELLMWAMMPLVNTHFKRIDKEEISRSSSLIVRMLEIAGVVGSDNAERLAVALADPGSLVLLASIFLITPDLVTRVACVFVEALYPVYASMFAYVNSSFGLKEKWLQYWLVSRIIRLTFDALSNVTRFIPLWARLELLLNIWLQMPYWSGAQQIYGWVAKCAKSARGHLPPWPGAAVAVSDPATERPAGVGSSGATPQHAAEEEEDT